MFFYNDTGVMCLIGAMFVFAMMVPGCLGILVAMSIMIPIHYIAMMIGAMTMLMPGHLDSDMAVGANAQDDRPCAVHNYT